MPVYNVEEYLDEALSSIYQQTYQDFELIAIDDGSCDSSPAILRQWQSKLGDRYHIIHQENGGLSSARNTGLNSAQGEYILFFDSDDCLHPRALEFIAQAAISADIIRFDVPVFHHGEVVQFPKLKGAEVESMTRDVYIASSLFRVAAWSYAIKRTVLDDTKLRFQDGLIHEDLLYTTLLMKDIFQVTYIHQGLYYYRIRSQSITTSSKNLVTKKQSVQYLLQTLYDLYNNEQDLTLKTFYYHRFFEAVGLFENYFSVHEIDQMYQKYQLFTGYRRPVKLLKKIVRKCINKWKK